MDTQRVIAAAFVNANLSITSTLSQYFALVVCCSLVVAGTINVKNTSLSLFEFLVQYFAQGYTLGTMVSEKAASSHVIVVLVCHVGMPVQKFVLIDRHTVTWSVTLVWISASVSNHYSL